MRLVTQLDVFVNQQPHAYTYVNQHLLTIIKSRIRKQHRGCSFMTFLSAESNQLENAKLLERLSSVSRCYMAGVWSSHWGLLSVFIQDQMDGSDIPTEIYTMETTCMHGSDWTQHTHVLLSHSRHQTHLHPSKFSIGGLKSIFWTLEPFT